MNTEQNIYELMLITKLIEAFDNNLSKLWVI